MSFVIRQVGEDDGMPKASKDFTVKQNMHTRLMVAPNQKDDNKKRTFVAPALL